MKKIAVFLITGFVLSFFAFAQAEEPDLTVTTSTEINEIDDSGEIDTIDTIDTIDAIDENEEAGEIAILSEVEPDSSDLEQSENDDKILEQDAEDLFFAGKLGFDEVVYDTELSLTAEEEYVEPVNSWRGNVEVAEINEFPSGIFAMAKGYYAGDTLQITNTKTSKIVDVLIIGNLDQSEEVGLKLSPEAAVTLGVPADCEASILIEERTAGSEERVVSSAKLTVFVDVVEDYSDIAQKIDEEEISIDQSDAEVEVEEITEADSEEESDDSDDMEEDSESDVAVAVVPVQEEQKAEEVIQPDEKPVVLEEQKVEIKKVVEKQVEEQKTVRKISESDLKKGIYIQLGFYKSEENLIKFQEKYRKKYKLFFVKTEKGTKIVTGRFSAQGYDSEIVKIKKDFPDAFRVIIK